MPQHPLPTPLSSLQLTSLQLSVPSQYVLLVELASGKVNSMTRAFWTEFKTVFDTASTISDIRSIVITAREGSKAFTAGLDLVEHATDFGSKGEDVARAALKQLDGIAKYQAAFTAMELCRQPVIIAITGACIGGGIDLITAGDIRLASRDSVFCVKEVDVGLAADVGTLQRLPKVIGSQSLVRDLCLTARTMKADEALSCGLVSSLYDTKQATVEAALTMAANIAAKSPVAVVGTKHLLNHARDHSVQESLQYTVVWNAAMLQSRDVGDSFKAVLAKKQPIYSNL